jgi:hypothetical protein
MKGFQIVLLIFVAVVGVSAQNAKVKSLIIDTQYPYYLHGNFQGENISGSIGGEFNSYFDRCRPCRVNTIIPLSVNRTGDNPIEINGGNVTIGDILYNGTPGRLEMLYDVPPATILLADNSRRRRRFSRQGTADIRLRLWRNQNEYPNTPPIFDQTLKMNCTAYTSVSRYWNTNYKYYLHDLSQYEWHCTAID